MTLGEYTRFPIEKRTKIPLRKDNVRISLPVGSMTDGSTTDFLAEVKLSSLGPRVVFERLRGKIDAIWIKGVPSRIH